MSATADALMAAVLADPADPLPRLVLADYLDDTGGPANAAWAEYIRLRAAATTEPSALTRELMRESADAVAPDIVAGLAMPAAAFLADPGSFLDLLPADRFTLRLAGFTPQRLASDPALCRSRRGLPLGRGDGRTVIAIIEQTMLHMRQAWVTDPTFSPALLVRVPTEELEPAIQRVYAQRALALVQPQVTATPLPPTLDEQLGPATAAMKRRYLEQLIAQARERGGSAIDITAYATHHWVRRVEGGRSLRWHRVGTALGRELVQAARALSPRRLHVRVRRRDSSFGEGVRIVLLPDSGQQTVRT